MVKPTRAQQAAGRVLAVLFLACYANLVFVCFVVMLPYYIGRRIWLVIREEILR